MSAEKVRRGSGQGRLVIELRAGDKLLVNGASLQFKTRTTMLVSNHVRFLFGRQIMEAEDATTPARRIYLAMQGAYVCEEQERAALVQAARALTEAYIAATTTEAVRQVLRLALAEMEAGEFWNAMRRVRTLFAHDDALLQHSEEEGA
ncbi:flagellar biosynthesis repressor FlbT [Teichococcus oryzae]|uniref:Flagellar biosynthesis repressor FlbT n=1 Tax=Teichococcus oryzae TaxID=1608942 RepID=A0A5B2TDF1_9PROT|nr:flagellar biosynthesis repressor FlbT [Pseudoroseomonas oryzae]KAA2212104.1 flagellar biosynthesis repressor FlbT [Pseudoroseomonas oryzae]